MAKLLSPDELRSLCLNSLPIVFFGAGAIAEKTAEKYFVKPQFVVDNNKDSQGLEILGTVVSPPQKLFENSTAYAVVICSTSIDQIEKQLLRIVPVHSVSNLDEDLKEGLINFMY